MHNSVLVIDDDPGTREALVEILRRAGYLVTSLEGVDQELEGTLSTPPYQVAVVDYHLPKANGLEVARRLRRLQPDCRIILISSEPPRAEASAGQGAVDYFLAKPFSKDVILEAVARLCPTPK
jgi:DNA-binding NtrC family response regulator